MQLVIVLGGGGEGERERERESNLFFLAHVLYYILRLSKLPYPISILVCIVPERERVRV